MRALLLPLTVLGLTLSNAPLHAQALQAPTRFDTLTISGGTSNPMRVVLRNSGAALMLMPSSQSVVADTLILTTPSTIRLPRGAFTLDITTLSAGNEAHVTLGPGPVDTLQRRRFQSTLFTPIRITRASAEAPLELTGAKVIVDPVP